MVSVGTLGGDWVVGRDVSADGSIVVGESKNALGEWRAFRWTEADGMVSLGTLGGNESRAVAISPDGSVIVGRSKDATGAWTGFRWSNTDGMQSLMIPGNPRPASVSAKGSIIVGTYWDRVAQAKIRQAQPFVAMVVTAQVVL